MQQGRKAGIATQRKNIKATIMYNRHKKDNQMQNFLGFPSYKTMTIKNFIEYEKIL
jgi:hypothetical protein